MAKRPRGLDAGWKFWAPEDSAKISSLFSKKGRGTGDIAEVSALFSRFDDFFSPGRAAEAHAASEHFSVAIIYDGAMFRRCETQRSGTHEIDAGGLRSLLSDKLKAKPL